MRKTIRFKIALLLMFTTLAINAQKGAYILDRVVAVVGDFHILQSEIEQQYLQMKMGSPYLPDDVRCEILDYFIQQKLLMTQAKIDSIEVSESSVSQNMQSRLNQTISQFGSEEAMAEYFGKPVFDIKKDLMKTMREMMITQQVQQSIVGDIKTTPSEVKAFYKSLPEDSIPYINSEVKIGQVVAYPPVDEDAEFEVKKRLLDLRKRIIDGESMSTLAILYSDDPSATTNFGEIGFRSKTDLDPAYVEAAWSLKEGQISKVIKSGFGYHIIQCIERRGDRVNTRHILLIPKIDADAKAKAIAKLDTIRNQIVNDSLSFQTAALYYSEDEKTRVNGGLVVNQMNQAPTFQLDQLETKDYYTIREMKVGDVSQPYESVDDKRKMCYKIVKLIARTEPHRANLKQDYLLLQNMSLSKKKNDVMNEWFREKKKRTYIHIDKSFQSCDGWNEELSKR